MLRLIDTEGPGQNVRRNGLQHLADENTGAMMLCQKPSMISDMLPACAAWLDAADVATQALSANTVSATKASLPIFICPLSD